MEIELLLKEAEELVDADNFLLAIKKYQEVLTFDSENISALISITDCLLKLNLSDQAGKYAEKAYHLFKDIDDTSAVNLSCVLIDQKNYQSCISILEREKQLGSINDLIYNNLGYAYYLNENFHKALENYTISISLEEVNPLAYCNRGVLKYYKFKDHEDGVKDLIKARNYGDFEAGMILQKIGGDKALLS